MNYARLKMALQELVAWVDWPLLIIVVAFLTLEVWELSERAPPTKGPDPAHLAYQAAIADAAIKRPQYRVPLKTIPTTMTTVNVVSFGRPDPIDPSKRQFDIWVALTDELRQTCKGAAKPTRRLQEILGLPPVDVPTYIVTELQVQRAGLIRPCVAGGDLALPYCQLDDVVKPALSSTASSAPSSGPPQPAASGSATPPLASAKTPPPAANSAQPAPSASTSATPVASNVAPIGSADSPVTERYSLAQMWNTYRIDFPDRSRKQGDYPFTGYPFTGMGWSYDWSDVPNHIGVSEFVIRGNVPVTVLNTKTPAEFCAP